MVFFFKGYRGHLDLHVLPHSFPTRRSSDLPMSPGCVGPSRRSLFLAPPHGASSRQSNAFPVPRRAQSLHRRVHHGRRWLLRRLPPDAHRSRELDPPRCPLPPTAHVRAHPRPPTPATLNQLRSAHTPP